MNLVHRSPLHANPIRALVIVGLSATILTVCSLETADANANASCADQGFEPSSVMLTPESQSTDSSSFASASLSQRISSILSSVLSDEFPGHIRTRSFLNGIASTNYRGLGESIFASALLKAASLRAPTDPSRFRDVLVEGESFWMIRLKEAFGDSRFDFLPVQIIANLLKVELTYAGLRDQYAVDHFRPRSNPNEQGRFEAMLKSLKEGDLFFVYSDREVVKEKKIHLIIKGKEKELFTFDFWTQSIRKVNIRPEDVQARSEQDFGTAEKHFYISFVDDRSTGHYRETRSKVSVAVSARKRSRALVTADQITNTNQNQNEIEELATHIAEEIKALMAKEENP